jgi:hypothetical protein
MITKKVEKKEEYYLTFSNEELSQLNLKEGDKFSWKIKEDGVFLEKWASLELEIGDWSKDVLLFLIEQSLEKNQTINEVIVDILNQIADDYKDVNTESSVS